MIYFIEHSIVEYIAYTPILPRVPFEPDSSSKSSFNRASHELLALSVVNWRLCRVCLPFLFRNIKVRDAEDAEKMKDYLVLFARFTQTLAIGRFDALIMKGDEAISHILPQLVHLVFVKLQQSSSHDRTILLRKLLAHPTVISVLVCGIPDESICDGDLSKLILEWASCNSCPKKYFERGMKLVRLNIYRSFKSQLIVSEMLSGLKELRITMSDAVSSSFLSALLSTCPTLEELWLVEYLDIILMLALLHLIQHIGLRRAIGQSSDEWYVMGIAIEVPPSYANRPLLAALVMIASSFPTVEKVTLDCDLDFGLHPKDLATVIAQFPSLKQLAISHLRVRLDFRSTKILPPIHQIGFNPLFDEELGVLCELTQSKIFSGLKEVQMQFSMINAISSSFLSALLSTYPTVEELTFIDDVGFHFTARTPSCISSFIKESDWLNLNELAEIGCIGLRRSIGQPSDEWNVTEIAMQVCTTPANRLLLATLMSVASSFPKLENLNLDVTIPEATYRLDVVRYPHRHLPVAHANCLDTQNDVTAAFLQFLSLKWLCFSGIHKLLDFGSKKITLPIRRGEDSNTLSEAENEILWYTAWVAERVRSIESIYIKDEHKTRLEGWLHVVNGNRDIGGTLRRSNDPHNEIEVLIDPSMLSST
ncbi:hypothetical protein EV360DRAFT_86608 [Lentinula raphanica]|nr:hypothetical protein EV360DRAFT_86608 [Lentinula raphanica]